ncbi:MAG: thioredoxin fold domain-containing protein [Marinicella sp.]|nr:thioredoxin fold domain-containing protein [Xanthomonadales bacterium]
MKLLIMITLFTTVQFARADVDKTVFEASLKKLSSSEVKVVEISETPISGVMEVLVDAGRGSEILYMSSDGKYILNGSIVDIDKRINITDLKKSVIRKEMMGKFGKSQRIDFFPEGKNMEHHVTVFTDIDCGYCRKLHSEMSQYNELGIGISYLFFPRAGLQSGSFDKAVNVWCSDNQQEAMTLAKAGETVEPKTCDNPIEEHYKAGVTAGVSGTPALVLDDGTLMPGYLPPEQLKQRLDLLAAK